MDKLDELLFSAYVVETGNWYKSIGEMNKILKQGLNSGEQTVVLLKRDCRLGAAPARPAGGAHLAAPGE